MPSYLVYGLRLDSNVPIGGLSPLQDRSGRADLDVYFGALPPTFSKGDASSAWYESQGQDTNGQPMLRIRQMESTGDLWLRYSDGTEFVVNADADSVWAMWPEHFTLDDAIVYFLGPILGIKLRLAGTPCLHASVVAVRDKALAFMGQAGAGKSTIAAAFARAGHRVLSDDLLVLRERDGGFWAEPGYSWVRLWPASAERLYGASEALPLLAEGWEKRYVDVAAMERFCDAPVEVGAIYMIGERTAQGPPTIEASTGPAALKSMIANSYTAKFPGPTERRRDFESFSRLVSAVPVRKLHTGDDWASLHELPATIVHDFSVSGTAVA